MSVLTKTKRSQYGKHRSVHISKAGCSRVSIADKMPLELKENKYHSQNVCDGSDLSVSSLRLLML